MRSPTIQTSTRFGFSRAVLVFLAATFFSASHLSAAIITGVTATTDMGSGFGTSLTNTLNGVGLSSYSLTATHDGTLPINSWVSSGTLTGTITFDLGGGVFIDSISFWNQNAGGPGALGSTGIQGVNILISTDGVIFTPLPGGPTTFAQATGAASLPPEILTFAPVLATDVRFAVSSNYGDAEQTGFAEVAFNATVPEPSAAVFVAIGLSGILCRRNRNDRNAIYALQGR